MSQPAAGAPPPPPPPPPPWNGLDRLPAELLLSIIQYLRTSDYIAFALAVYPVLQNHGLVPALSRDIYNHITQQRPPPPDRGAFHWRFPVELTEEIMQYLEPEDRIAFLFSHRDLIRQYLPGMSTATRKRLWNCREKE